MSALRQKQSIRSIETVKVDTARRNWSISIAFSRWREDRWMHDPPKSPTSAWLWRFFPRIPKKLRLEATFSAFSTLVRRRRSANRRSDSLRFGFEFQSDRSTRLARPMASNPAPIPLITRCRSVALMGEMPASLSQPFSVPIQTPTEFPKSTSIMALRCGSTYSTHCLFAT
jgi:hypothetical protein